VVTGSSRRDDVSEASNVGDAMRCSFDWNWPGREIRSYAKS
jgi:hypothetical protein